MTFTLLRISVNGTTRNHLETLKQRVFITRATIRHDISFSIPFSTALHNQLELTSICSQTEIRKLFLDDFINDPNENNREGERKTRIYDLEC